MNGARAAANRSTNAVRATIPGRAAGAWNFDSKSSKASLGTVLRSPPEITDGELMTSEFTPQKILPDKCRINEALVTPRGSRAGSAAGRSSLAAPLARTVIGCRSGPPGGWPPAGRCASGCTALVQLLLG